MKPSLHPTNPCLCSSNSLPQNDSLTNIFHCMRCQNSFHISCYDNPTNAILTNTIICLRCRLDVYEPFWSLVQNFIVQPIVLPADQPVELALHLKLSREDMALLKQTDTYKVAIFCTRLKFSSNQNLIYEWPSELFQISLDDASIEYNPYTYAFVENILTPQLQLKISCKEPLDYTSVLGVSLVKNIDMKDFTKEIVKNNKLTFEDAKKRYKEIKEGEKEFKLGIPTNDPMSSFFLCLPARGATCQHIACFDLVCYISYNQNNFTDCRWNCPICQKIVNTNQIVVDLFLHNIVKEIRKNNKDEKLTHIQLKDLFAYDKKDKGKEKGKEDDENDPEKKKEKEKEKERERLKAKAREKKRERDRHRGKEKARHKEREKEKEKEKDLEKDKDKGVIKKEEVPVLVNVKDPASKPVQLSVFDTLPDVTIIDEVVLVEEGDEIEEEGHDLNKALDFPEPLAFTQNFLKGFYIIKNFLIILFKMMKLN